MNGDSRDPSRRSVLAALGAAAAGAVGRPAGGTERERSEAGARRPRGSVRGAEFSRVVAGRTYRLRYRRRVAGRPRTVRVDVPRERYRAARAADRSLVGTFEAALGDDLAAAVAGSLGAALTAGGVDDPLARLRAAVGFVRRLPYEPDAESVGEAGYPRYVAETLVDHVGDCEDYAALLAGVVAAPPFDLDPALVLLPGHVGVGVDPDAVGADGLPTLRVAGREYLYLDATYRVGLGTLPADHDEGVVAVRDGGWLVGDPGAFAAHVREAAALHAAARRPASR